MRLDDYEWNYRAAVIAQHLSDHQAERVANFNRQMSHRLAVAKLNHELFQKDIALRVARLGLTGKTG